VRIEGSGRRTTPSAVTWKHSPSSTTPDHAVGGHLEALAVEHDELAVERLDGAEPEVAVQKELGEGEVSVVRAPDERVDRRGLVHGAFVGGYGDESIMVEAGEVEVRGLREVGIDDVVLVPSVVRHRSGR
jgi:hypothetical protein